MMLYQPKQFLNYLLQIAGTLAMQAVNASILFPSTKKHSNLLQLLAYLAISTPPVAPRACV